MSRFARDQVHAALYLSTKLAGLHYDYEKDFARFVYKEPAGTRERMRCLEMDIIHKLEYSMVFANPYTLLHGYFLRLQVSKPSHVYLQESGSERMRDFDDARKLLGNAMNREECLNQDMHHLVKGSLLQGSELSHLLNSGKELRYDEALLQSLLDELASS